MHLLRLAQLAALFTLRDWPALLLDLEERPIGVVAVGRAVSFDAGFAGVDKGQEGEEGEEECDAPSVLLIIDEWLGGSLLGVVSDVMKGGAPWLACC